MNSILIIAGEASGEKYGADLVKNYRTAHSNTLFFGIGGAQMKKQGVEILFPIDDIAVVGAFEVISHLPRIKGVFNRIRKEIRSRNPQAAVLIDSPDFNLRLAKILSKLSIPVLYYISPTVWAWRKGRLKKIKKYVDRMMLIFPFEEKIYKEAEIPAVFIGHPLKEAVKVSLTKQAFFQKYNLDHQKKIITCLPGSRKSEIRYHMPILIEALVKLQKKHDCQFLLPLAENIEEKSLIKFFASEKIGIKILKEDKYEAIAFCDLALSSCGTANLEAALLGTPIVSFYKLSPISYSLGIKLIKIRSYSIVNILAEKKIIPELIQSGFTPENLCQEASQILDSEDIRSEMTNEFVKIKAMLGEKNASENAAAELAELTGL
jgi:lipid-A-disaccharide synthase